uniref:Uncharacterized protein n=1 Tax=Arundo donax TaxID=35708 RepID=A0A0A9B514_ARUDO
MASEWCFLLLVLFALACIFWMAKCNVCCFDNRIIFIS